MERLPNEILARIFECAIYDNSSTSRFATYDNALATLLVCKFWTSLTRPVFYQRIKLDIHASGSFAHIHKLHRVIQLRGELWRSVREFEISIFDEQENTCNVLAEIVILCQAVQQITLRAQWIHTHLLVDAVGKLPALSVLTLSGQSNDSSQALLYRLCASLPHLQHLRLERCAIPRNDDDTIIEWPLSGQKTRDGPIQQSGYKNEAPPRIEVHDPIDPPASLKRFLAHFPRLESLSLSFPTFGNLNNFLRHPVAPLYNHVAVRDLLWAQRHTLRFLNLAGLPVHCKRHKPRSWCFRDFPGLKELRMHVYDLLIWPRYFPEDMGLGKEGIHRKAGWQLVGPNPKRLEIDFNTGKMCDIWTARPFGQRIAHHLWEFIVGLCHGEGELDQAEGPPMSQPLMSRGLQTLHVEFDPKVEPDNIRTSEDSKWPWSYLEQVRDLAGVHGVQMTWNRPSVSLEDWVAMRGHE
ncbi:MAG: hypothetical protein Q9227_000408 [Pyrenula ochraceoflavens]